MSDTPVTVIILAGQRTGITNPLAMRAGVSHKCLMPICGEPLIRHVVRTIVGLPDIARIRIVLERDAHDAVAAAIAAQITGAVPIDFVESRPNIVDSMLAGAAADDGPFVVTTADNVLLTAEGFACLRAGLRTADGVIGVTTKERVLAAHPEGQRNFYNFRDGGYANCNIYGLANRKAFGGAEIFREGGQFQAHVGRMIRAFGLFNIIAMRMGWVTLAEGFRRIGKRFSLRIDPVVFKDGALAIDVDNERTYSCAETIMKQRQAIAASA